MGTLNSGYVGQHSDAASLSMLPQQQQQPPPQVAACSVSNEHGLRFHGTTKKATTLYSKQSEVRETGECLCCCYS